MSPKGGAKVGIKKAPLKRSAITLRIMLKYCEFCEFSAFSLRFFYFILRPSGRRALQKSLAERLNLDWYSLSTLALCSSDAYWSISIQPICCRRYNARQYSILVVDCASSAASLSRIFCSVNLGDTQKNFGGVITGSGVMSCTCFDSEWLFS